MNELEEKIKKSKAIDILINYLIKNNLIDDIINHVFITRENGEIINKINFYRDEEGKILNIYEIKSNNLEKKQLQEIVMYRYEEVNKLYFDNNLVEEKKILNNSPSKSYNQIKRTYQPLKSDEQLMAQQLRNLIKQYPCLFIELILYYNIDINELINSNNKKLVLN